MPPTLTNIKLRRTYVNSKESGEKDLLTLSARIPSIILSFKLGRVANGYIQSIQKLNPRLRLTKFQYPIIVNQIPFSTLEEIKENRSYYFININAESIVIKLKI